MKSLQSDIRSALDKGRTFSKRLASRVAELDEARRDAEGFSVTLEKLGTPSYKQEAAFQNVSTKRAQLQACNDVIEKLESEIEECIKDAHQPAQDWSRMCVAVLEPVYNALLNGIAKDLRPHCTTDAQATAMPLPSLSPKVR